MLRRLPLPNLFREWNLRCASEHNFDWAFILNSSLSSICTTQARLNSLLRIRRRQVELILHCLHNRGHFRGRKRFCAFNSLSFSQRQ